jgi:hypothetical protein
MEPGYYWATSRRGNRVVVLVSGTCATTAHNGDYDFDCFTDYSERLTDPRTPATAGDDTRKDG